VQVAALLFDGVTALDVVGPYEVLSRAPGFAVEFVAADPGPKRTERAASLTLVADKGLDEAEAPDLLLLPGGGGVDAAIADERVIAWIRSAHERSRYTASVCSGSLLLGAAGLLEGLTATTHWLRRDRLPDYGAEPVPDRVVRHGKIWMAAGVSAGIDMSLRLVEAECGPEVAQAIQLSIEYDPDPPFDTGSPDKAPPEIVEAVRAAAQRTRS
jgi:transcriptional regulator GlxA family with amidase domain